MQVKAKVFRNKDGNRYLFPAYIYPAHGSSDDIPGASFWFNLRHKMRLATGLEIEDGWHEFDDDAFPHVKVDLTSPGFAHGGAHAYLFDGPTFQDILKETEMDILLNEDTIRLWAADEDEAPARFSHLRKSMTQDEKVRVDQAIAAAQMASDPTADTPSGAIIRDCLIEHGFHPAFEYGAEICGQEAFEALQNEGVSA